MRSTPLLLALLAAVPLLTACRAEPKAQGRQGVLATFRLRTLSAELPDSARVPAVIAAADTTMRARGYAVKRSESTEDAGEVVGVPPRTTDMPRMVVRAHRTATGTAVELTYEPLGDQELSRSVLDSILSRLGM